MGLFGFFENNNKKKIKDLEKKNRNLLGELQKKEKRIRDLELRHEEKDSFFKEVISDGLRHKSKLSAKHMADLKKYKNGN